jgi:hypothetical protein
MYVDISATDAAVAEDIVDEEKVSGREDKVGFLRE